MDRLPYWIVYRRNLYPMGWPSSRMGKTVLQQQLKKL